MSADVLKCDAREIHDFIDQHLTEDDKSMIFEKMKSNDVRSVHNGDAFLLYSMANKVKAFVEDGHHVSILSYGIDFFIDKKPSRFSSIQCASVDDLEDFVYQYCLEWHQESGEIDNDLLDRLYAWMLISPYTAMAMTEDVRSELHRTVDFLWMCTVTGNKAFSNECYDRGKSMINGKLKYWFENVPIMVPGCGYENIIKPMEF